MEFNLGPYFEALAAAQQDVDEIAVDMLEQNKYSVFHLLYETLRNTSEEWTGATAKTLFIDGPLYDGNFIYLELGAHTSQDPAAWYKEFGRPKQAAEPFLRPTLLYYRRGGLKQWMEMILEKYGLQV